MMKGFTAKFGLFSLLITFVIAQTPDEQKCPICPCLACHDDSECQHGGFCQPDGSCLCPPGTMGPNCADLACVHGNLTDMQTCNCQPGWEGIWCNVCQEDSVCATLPGQSPNSYCSQSWVPVKQSQLSCISEAPALIALLEVPAKASVNIYANEATGLITGNFQLLRAEEPGIAPSHEIFNCRLANCTTFSSDSTVQWSCTDVSCAVSCRVDVDPSCTAILVGIIGMVEGPITFSCPTDGNKCLFIEPKINLISKDGLELVCKASECVNPEQMGNSTFISNNGSFVGNVEEDEGYAAPIILGGMLLLLFVGSAFIGGVLLSWHRKFSSCRSLDSSHKTSTHRIMFVGDKGTRPQPLSFNKMSYTIKKDGKEKVVLHNVSGVAYPGECLAIMGPSGAGKSTLLDILSNRPKDGKIKGELLMGGRPLSRKYERMIGFVDQNECLHGMLTVREALTYSAMLRLPGCWSLEAKQSRVNDVMENLKITSLQNSRIGNEFTRGISGGEKRRVSIGMELVPMPSVLFLDEPTSGLDSNNAYVVAECLSRLARHDMTTVVMTIHQPRSNIFRLFDRLLLLAQGQVAYFGQASEAIPHFQSIGHSCPHDYNPADFLIDLVSNVQPARSLSTDHSDFGEEDILLDTAKYECDAYEPSAMTMSSHKPTSRANDLVARYCMSETAMKTNNEIVAIGQESTGNNDRAHVQSNQGAPWLMQVIILSYNSALNLLRNPYLLVGHLLAFTGIGLLIGMVYYQSPLGGDDLSDGRKTLVAQFEQRMGVLLIVCAFLAFGSLSSLELFHQERSIYMHERQNRFYGVSSYFVAKVLMDVIPLRLFPPLAMGAVCYYMVGLRPGFVHFLYFEVTLVLVNLAATSICMILGVVCKRLSSGNLTASIIMLFSLMLTDIFNNRNSMPPYLVWLHYCSFFNYGYEALVINELDGVYLSGPILGADVQVSSTEILGELGFKPEMFTADLVILGCVVIMNLFISYLCFKWMVKQRR